VFFFLISSFMYEREQHKSLAEPWNGQLTSSNIFHVWLIPIISNGQLLLNTQASLRHATCTSIDTTFCSTNCYNGCDCFVYHFKAILSTCCFELYNNPSCHCKGFCNTEINIADNQVCLPLRKGTMNCQKKRQQQTLLWGDDASSTIMPAHVHTTSTHLLYNITLHYTFPYIHSSHQKYVSQLLLVTMLYVDASWAC